jgi:beta-glucanase (GH16 family)
MNHVDPPTPSANARPADPNLVWRDDFNGSAGTPPDASHWTYDIGGTGWGNSELDYDTKSSANIADDGKGHLAISARRDKGTNTCWYGPCQYTSGRIHTGGKFDITYGRIAARIKLPAGQGLWPAFWMLEQAATTGSVQQPGEIDVMENLGREPATIHGSLHGPNESTSNPPSGTYTLAAGERFSSAFHTFAIDWTPRSITFSVDGKPYEVQTAKTTGHATWVFDRPFFLVLDLAVGGNWPGSPDATTTFPATMLVDWVAVYKNG